MTIEEWIAAHASKAHRPLVAEQIEFLGFEASPSHVWSEYTSEDFSAKILYRIKGERYEWFLGKQETDYEYLGESEVCEFLNELFPSPERSGT